MDRDSETVADTQLINWLQSLNIDADTIERVMLYNKLTFWL